MDTTKIVTNSLGTEVPILSPFQEGFNAYFNDKTTRDGPYPIGHPNRDGWLLGFNEARKEFDIPDL